jgi:hypothetical protein
MQISWLLPIHKFQRKMKGIVAVRGVCELIGLHGCSGWAKSSLRELRRQMDFSRKCSKSWNSPSLTPESLAFLTTSLRSLLADDEAYHN